MELRFSQVQIAHSKLFSDAMEIYLESFPANERQCIDVIKKRIDAGDSKLYIGKFENEVVCIGMLWNLKHSRFVLLDYLAVKAKYRNLKIGSNLVNYLSANVFDKNKSLIIEAEHPGYGENRLERKKRIQFYLNNGAYIFDNTPYLLPPLDDTIPTEMILMVYPPSPRINYQNKEIRELIIRLYKELYQRDSSDSLLNSFVNDIPKIITISKNIPYDNR